MRFLGSKLAIFWMLRGKFVRLYMVVHLCGDDVHPERLLLRKFHPIHMYVCVFMFVNFILMFSRDNTIATLLFIITANNNFSTFHPILDNSKTFNSTCLVLFIFFTLRKKCYGAVTFMN